MGHITLRELNRRLVPYRRLPVPVSATLANSVMLSLLINAVSIPLLMVSVPGVQSIYPVSSRLYVWRMEAWVNALLRLFIQASDYLLYANALSAALCTLFFVLTLGATRHAGEWVHWLGWAPTVVSGIGAVALMGLVGAVLFVTLLAALFWVALGGLIILIPILLIWMLADI